METGEDLHLSADFFHAVDQSHITLSYGHVVRSVTYEWWSGDCLVGREQRPLVVVVLGRVLLKLHSDFRHV